MLSLFPSTSLFSQVRILDLGGVSPEEFATPSIESPEPRDFPENFLLPPVPVTDLSELETAGSVGTLNGSVGQPEVELSAFLPPALENDLFPASDVGTSDEELTEFTEQLSQIENESIAQISGNYHDSVIEESTDRTVNYAEMPILATHKVLGVAHRYTHALGAPSGKGWIFWRSECQGKQPGPICCGIQKRTANWRHSAAHLQGCLPEGYSLRQFIESVNSVEFHASNLAANGPVDQGGSFEDAKQIEGGETKPIQQVSINITPPAGELPGDRAEEKFEQLPIQVQMPGTHRLWAGTSYYWNASLLNHQPLYFEDVNLERNGFSRGYLQPLVSGVKFFGTLPALPYLMAANAPHETSFTLGQSRPGSHACYVCERPPLRLDAAAVEAAAVVGLVFLIP